MQPRHPANFIYPYAKPAQYTDTKTSAYFTKSGITQLGYIRHQLENLGNDDSTNENSKASINQIIALIDGLADKSLGSSMSVGKRLKTLDVDLMKIFTVENGAIVFEDRALLSALKIITQGIAAIEPDDLDPPKLVLKALGKNNYQLCETIKSTMAAINAQINFLLQLEKNAEESEGLYELMNEIIEIPRNLSSIIFKKGTIVDQRLNDGQGSTVEPMYVIEKVNDAIGTMNNLIRQYTNSNCTSITLRARGEKLSPMETFDLMLKVNGSLSHITQSGHLVGKSEIYPIFMTTTVPFEGMKLCASLQSLVVSTKDHTGAAAESSRLLDETTNKLNSMITSLQAAIERKAGNAQLKGALASFKSSLSDKINTYIEMTMAKDSKKTVENNTKLAICDELIRSLNRVKLDDDFTPDFQFSQYISAVAKAYYEHNDHCATTEKSPGQVGEILVDAMNHLAELSANIVANDSYYHQRNITEINKLLHPDVSNATSFRR